jgi:ribosomal protein S13
MAKPSRDPRAPDDQDVEAFKLKLATIVFSKAAEQLTSTASLPSLRLEIADTLKQAATKEMKELNSHMAEQFKRTATIDLRDEIRQLMDEQFQQVVEFVQVNLKTTAGQLAIQVRESIVASTHGLDQNLKIHQKNYEQRYAIALQDLDNWTNQLKAVHDQHQYKLEQQVRGFSFDLKKHIEYLKDQPPSGEDTGEASPPANLSLTWLTSLLAALGLGCIIGAALVLGMGDAWQEKPGKSQQQGKDAASTKR